MERRSTLVRRARLAGVALIVVAAAAGCSGNSAVGQSPAATVNGHDITADEVQELVDAQEAVVKVQAKVAKTKPADLAKQLEAFQGTGTDTVPTSEAAAALSQLVRIEVIRDAVKANKGQVTKAQRTEARSSLEQQATQAGLKLTDLPKAFVDTQVELSALQAALAEAAPVEEADLRAAYEEQVASLANMCVSLVVTADEAAAQAAHDRIQGGEDIAAVSAEVSTDPTLKERKGEAGCATPAEIAQSLGDAVLAAKAGDLLAPTESPGGWLVTKVTSLTVPTFEEARGQLSSTASEATVQAEIDAALKRADVTVDSRYGRWDAKTATVVPPRDPKGTTTTTPLDLVPGSAETVPAGS